MARAVRGERHFRRNSRMPIKELSDEQARGGNALLPTARAGRT
jgi:hypothetical protein